MRTTCSRTVRRVRSCFCQTRLERCRAAARRRALINQCRSAGASNTAVAEVQLGQVIGRAIAEDLSRGPGSSRRERRHASRGTWRAAPGSNCRRVSAWLARADAAGSAAARCRDGARHLPGSPPPPAGERFAFVFERVDVAVLRGDGLAQRLLDAARGPPVQPARRPGGPLPARSSARRDRRRQLSSLARSSACSLDTRSSVSNAVAQLLE